MGGWGEGTLGLLLPTPGQCSASSLTVPLIIISGYERDDNKGKIKDRLRKLLTKRPTIEELEKKGIIKGIMIFIRVA